MKKIDSCIPCGIRPLSRNHYFNGKLLVERDFRDEQTYHVLKQRTLNSVLHGHGTVCGLGVRAHPTEACRDEFVVVEPGVALDCCGREIIVPERTLVPVAELVETLDLAPSLDGSRDLFIALCYEEEAGESVPVILPDCECGDEGEAANRIVEGFGFHLFVERSGERVEAHAPLRAGVDWSHTITLSGQSPRAVASDDEFHQLYVAAQEVVESEDPPGVRIYAYRSDNHDLITALDGGTAAWDLAISASGENIYLAGAGLEAGEVGPVEGIAVYRESAMRGDPDPGAVLDLGGAARLGISPRSGALFALHLEDGGLRGWSEEAVNEWLGEDSPGAAGPDRVHELEDVLDNTPAGEPSGLRQGASLMDVSQDGRFLFVADPEADGNESVRVVTVAQLFADDPAALVSPSLPEVAEDERAVALKVSRDSRYLYLLTRLEEEDGPRALLRRFEWRITEQELLPSGRGGVWPGEPLDLSLAPNERWAYVLESGTEEEPTRLDIVSVDEVTSLMGGEPVNPVSERINLAGEGRFGRLTTLGERLYVAADDRVEGDQPERGLVAVLDVEEADCGELFYRPLDDGCPSCDGEDRDCVVLAHLPEYRPLQRMEDPETAREGDAVLDNRTHRRLVTSTQNISEVVRCMLDEGAVAGTPGPRGPAGETGEPGEPGERGPGIEELDLTILDPDDDATATLTPIPDDPEGDLRLDLGIPGAERGPRGPGVTAVEASTLEPDEDATATLEPIAGDPEGDLRLVLGLPRGEDGEDATVEPPPELTHITNLSWVHGGNLATGMDELDRLLRGGPGIAIAFDNPVRIDGVIQDVVGNDRPGSVVFELLARQRESPCWCPLELLCLPFDDFDDADGRITSVEARDPDDLQPETPALGFQLVLDPEGDVQLEEGLGSLLKVVFRADFALDGEGRAVDGNHVGGGVPDRPSGNGSEGDTFESWFTVRG